jgi:hypothetical protein
MTNELNELTDLINKFKNTDIYDGESLVYLNQQILTTCFYLETERDKYHTKYETLVNSLVLQGASVARAVNSANVDVPELYNLRRILDVAYRVADQIRTNISWVKNEKHQAEKM